MTPLTFLPGARHAHAAHASEAALIQLFLADNITKPVTVPLLGSSVRKDDLHVAMSYLDMAG